VRFPFLLLFLVPLLPLACGGSEKPAKPAASAPADDAPDEGCGEESAGGDYTPDKGTATVKGVVKFEGEPPVRRPVDFGAEEHCAGAHKEPMLSETYIIGGAGGLANVFVQVKGGLTGWKFPAPSGSKVLDQIGCNYVPHVLGLGVNQALLIRNSDPIMHNIHAFNLSTGKDEFNFAQTQKGAEATKKFPRPVVLQVKCEVHGWMGSFVHVVKHPFYFVTGEDGAFALPGLPPGTYDIEAWHEKLGTKSSTVTVADGETKEIAFAFSK